MERRADLIDTYGRPEMADLLATIKAGNTWIHFISDTDAPAAGTEVRARRGACSTGHRHRSRSWRSRPGRSRRIRLEF